LRLNKPYEIFEHTADIGIRVRGKDEAELFRNAGLALFQISSRKQYVKNKQREILTVKLQAKDREELFFNWLNELLSLSSAKKLIFHDIKVNKLVDNCLEAQAAGSDMANYKVNIEIKAATYHQLKIEKTEGGWLAEVILDV
jgi:SHS2 domain-containing protein